MNGIFVVSAVLALTLHAQEQPQAPATFEVVSIRPHPEPVRFSGSSTSGARETWTAITLIDLIVEAWNLKYYQVSMGPSWMGSEHFDVVAKADGDTPAERDRFRQMLRAMLADRFRLRVHTETKELPVFALLPAKTGVKLRDPDMSSNLAGTVGDASGIHITASHGTLQRLAEQLSNTAGRPVLDRTGLTGVYAFKLDFSPSNEVTPSDASLPSMSTALEDQLGLRLQPQKAPLEVLVIDSAERPSAN